MPGHTRDCVECGQSFTISARERNPRKYCRRACRDRQRRRESPPPPRLKDPTEFVINCGTCTECGAETKSKPGAGRAPLTCSLECGRERKRRRHAEHYATYKTRRLELNDARRRQTREGMTAADIETTIAYRKHISGAPCTYCGEPGEHIDHRMPVARGGRDWWWNLVPACATCNHRKGVHCETWMRVRARKRGVVAAAV